MRSTAPLDPCPELRDRWALCPPFASVSAKQSPSGADWESEAEVLGWAYERQFYRV